MLLLSAPNGLKAASPIAQSLRPAASTESHITTESSQVLPAWTPSAALLTAYDQNLGSNNAAGNWQIDRRASSHLLLSYGMLDHAQIDIDLPMVLYQDGQAGDGYLSLRSAAFGDLRTTIKGTLFRLPDRGLGVGLALDIIAPTGSQPALSGVGGVSATPMGLVEYRGFRGITGALNFGYMVRPDVREEDFNIGDAIAYRLAGKIPFGANLQFAGIAELDGNVGVVDRSAAPLTIRAGFRWRMRSGIVVGLYGGGSPVPTLGTPDVQGLFQLGFVPPHRISQERAFVGSPSPTASTLAHRYERIAAQHQEKTTLAPRNPQDKDGDFIMASADLCPHVAEDLDGFEDQDGCPEWDNDRDGVRDTTDLCIDAPEITNGFADWDGCPDYMLADGSWVSRDQFIPEEFFPDLQFVARTARLSESSQVELARTAELIRLNPWIGQIELSIFIDDSSGDSKQLEQSNAILVNLAHRRGRTVERALENHGIESWRVVLLDPQHSHTESNRQSKFALRAPITGLQPLAPNQGALDNMVAKAVAEARKEDALTRRQSTNSLAPHDPNRTATGHDSRPSEIEVMAQGPESPPSAPASHGTSHSSTATPANSPKPTTPHSDQKNGPAGPQPPIKGQLQPKPTNLPDLKSQPAPQQSPPKR